MLTFTCFLKVENLCINFGPKIGHLNDVTYYDFPVPEALTPAGVEEKLRALGFGYRAKYIHQTARMIVNDHPVGWLGGLRDIEYKDAHEALLQLQGVGPKVADCVCLMSLDKTEAVPVDTHGLCAQLKPARTTCPRALIFPEHASVTSQGNLADLVANSVANRDEGLQVRQRKAQKLD